MARRITRAETVGSPAPSIEGLREALATFLDGLAQTEEKIAEFLATGRYSDSKALADAGPLREQAYHDDAVRQIGVDLGWTLALEGRESEVEEVRQIFRTQLAKVVDERNASIENGWRYKDERKVLADRERFWEAAESERRGGSLRPDMGQVLRLEVTKRRSSSKVETSASVSQPSSRHPGRNL